MQNVAEASEEVLWTAALTLITGVLVFALFAGISWAATMLGAWAGTF
jgi:hypothetical protein